MTRRLGIFLLSAALLVAVPRGQDAPALNDKQERAETVTLASRIELDMTPGENGYGRPYFYQLDIPEADANARFDAVLRNVTGAVVQFAYLDARGNVIAQFNGKDPE